MDSMPEEHDPFEHARRDIRRARYMLNFLVFLSALAGAAFFGYVLHSIRPLAPRLPEPVDIPTSRAEAVQVTLRGEGAELQVMLSDLDEAEEYSAELSERRRADMAIEQAGVLLRLAVRNAGERELSITLNALTLTTQDGDTLSARRLGDVAELELATASGRMQIGQAAPSFTLPAGAMRQFQVFVPGSPPRVAALQGAVVEFNHGSVELSRHEAGVGE
jgi:hypothetical protein